MPVRETTAGGMTRPGSTRADHSCTSWLPATSINPISVMRSRSALAPVVSRSRKTRRESNIADLSGQGLHHFILARECIIDALAREEEIEKPDLEEIMFIARYYGSER